MEKLHRIAAAVDEDKDITQTDIVSHLIIYHSA
jgi:hypothetical protein